MSKKSSNVDEEYLQTRSRWVSPKEKEKQEWGDQQAKKLWDGLYGRYSLKLEGSTVLDIGCSWGYLLKFIGEHFAPGKLIGTDVNPHWESSDHGWDYASEGEKFQFFASDLSEIDQIAEQSVDLILCTSVLQYMTPEKVEANVAKAYNLLKPGGEMILRTRVWTSYIGADLHRDITLPYAHLLYSERETAEVLKRKGKMTKYLNWLTANTYLIIFTRAGFEILDARRRMNNNAPKIMERVIEEYPWISPEELLCSELEVRLIRPFEPTLVEHNNSGSDEGVEEVIKDGFDEERSEYSCIVCETSSTDFEDLNGVPDRRCPECGSVERTRGVLSWLSSNINISGLEVFAVAPSGSATRFISELEPARFDRCDIRPLNGFEIQADISEMPEVESDSYDFAMAIKVLEHCANDHQAISELRRILKPGGRLIVNGDVRGGTTTQEVDEPTSYYGKEAFEEYNIGTFRRYGLENLTELLSEFFEVKTYEVEDPPTGYKGFLIECLKNIG